MRTRVRRTAASSSRLTYAAITAALLSPSLFTPSASAVNYYWTGLAGDGKWSTLNNWSINGGIVVSALLPPSSSDNAFFNYFSFPSSQSINLATDSSINEISCVSGNTTTLNGSNLSLGTGGLNVSNNSICTFNCPLILDDQTWNVAAPSTVNVLGAVTLNGGTGNLTVSNNLLPGGNVTLQGPVTGFGTLIMNSNGTLTVSGNTTNTQVGLTVENGTVVLAKNSTPSVHAITRNIEVDAGTLQLAGSGNNQIASSSSLQLLGGTFDLNGQSQALASAFIYGNGANNAGALLDSAAGNATLSATSAIILETDTTIGVPKSTSTLTISSGVQTFDNLSVVGNGALAFTSSYDTSQRGNISLNGATLVTYSSVSVNSAALSSGATWNIFSGAVSISNFSLAAGTTVRFIGGTINYTGSSPLLLSNTNPAAPIGGIITLNVSMAINTSSGLNIDPSAILTLSGGTLGGSGLVTNNGAIFCNFAGSVVNADLTNKATRILSVQSVPVRFNGNVTNQGNFTGNSAGSISFTNSFTNTGLFNNAGSLFVTQNVTNSGNFTQSGPQIWLPFTSFTNSGGTASFSSNAELYGLSITGGTVDITTSKFIIEPTPASKSSRLSSLQSNIANGSLIASQMPARFALALVDNAVTKLSTFGGMTADPNSLLLSQELIGDANLDGNIDLTDLSTVLNHFGATSSNWTDGNFDNAPTIDLTDLSDVLNNFGSTNPNASSSQLPTTPTPEPAALAILLPVVWNFASRRRQGSAPTGTRAAV